MVYPEVIERPAKEHFRFYAAYYLPVFAGIRAYTIDELIEGIRRADGLSIFYHVFHPMFSSHVVPEDLHNDFAVWIKNELHLDELAYSVSDISAEEPRTVEDVRRDLINILSKESYDVKAKRPFNFMTCKPVVYDLGKEASNFAELLDQIASITFRSIAYHFVFKRVMGYAPKNDFSLWIERNYSEFSDISKKLSLLDPQTYTEEEKLREDLLVILKEVFK